MDCMIQGLIPSTGKRFFSSKISRLALGAISLPSGYWGQNSNTSGWTLLATSSFASYPPEVAFQQISDPTDNIYSVTAISEDVLRFLSELKVTILRVEE
jgi:hypothetical protein